MNGANVWWVEAGDATVAIPGYIQTDLINLGAGYNCPYFPLEFACHLDGIRQPLTRVAPDKTTIAPTGTLTMQFVIPVYSGILGLLMPEKKLLPLNLLPLDIEIVFNPHALYSSSS